MDPTPAQPPGKMDRFIGGLSSATNEAAPIATGLGGGCFIAAVQTGSKFTISVGTALIALPLAIQFFMSQITNKMINKVCRNVDPIRVCELKAMKEILLGVAILIIALASGVLCPPLAFAIFAYAFLAAGYHLHEKMSLQDRLKRAEPEGEVTFRRIGGGGAGQQPRHVNPAPVQPLDRGVINRTPPQEPPRRRRHQSIDNGFQPAQPQSNARRRRKRRGSESAEGVELS